MPHKPPVPWPPIIPPSSPLTFHPSGFQARIGGRTRWVCGKRTHDEALAIYFRKQAAVTSGRKIIPERPVVRPGAYATLHDILNGWIIDRRTDAQHQRLSLSAYKQYRYSAKRIDGVAGHYPLESVSPDTTRFIFDALAEQYSLDFAQRAIAHLRACCRHAVDMKWCKPVAIGSAIVASLSRRPAPSMKWRLYTPAEIRTIRNEFARLIGEGDGRRLRSLLQLHAMFLLALNGGFGGKELSELRKGSVDLERGVVFHDRGKTGARHVTPLWPETIAALVPVLRMAHKVHSEHPPDLLFVTRLGHPWCRTNARLEGRRIKAISPLDNVNDQFTVLTEPLGLKFDGQGFYKLKHLACTTADAANDPHATFALFGHQLPGAKSHYVRVGEDRLRRVVEFVRWHVLNPPEHSPEWAAHHPAHSPRSARDGSSSHPEPAPGDAWTA